MNGRFQCDECGWRATDKVELTEALIDTPCPKCGANMLPREQYETTVAFVRSLPVNEALMGLYMDKLKDAPHIELSVNPVTGSVKLEVKG